MTSSHHTDIRSNDRPLRIAYVWDRLLPTTATDAEQALSTITALARAGAQVRVVVPTRRGEAGLTADALRAYYQVTGDFEVVHIELPLVENLPLRKAMYAWRSPRSAALTGVDVVHTRNCATFLGLAQAGHPVLYDTHRAWPDKLPWLRPWLRKSLARPNCIGVACHSQYTRASYLRMGADPERVTVMRNGYDPVRFTGSQASADARRRLQLPTDRVIATYAGHVTAFKGMGNILRMARDCPEVLFLLVGSQGKGLTERRAARLANVRIVPWQPYDCTIDYLSASDVLLLPPSAAPLQVAGHTVLPMKVYGYLAAERAILGPATPDLEEVLVDGENARLVVPGDAAAAATALRELAASPALRDRLAQAAHTTAQNLTWDARAARLLAFMRQRRQSMRG